MHNIVEEVRRRLHKQFLITYNRPTFKKVQANALPDEESGSAYLENTHVGLGPSGGKFLFTVTVLSTFYNIVRNCGEVHVFV